VRGRLDCNLDVAEKSGIHFFWRVIGSMLFGKQDAVILVVARVSNRFVYLSTRPRIGALRYMLISPAGYCVTSETERPAWHRQQSRRTEHRCPRTDRPGQTVKTQRPRFGRKEVSNGRQGFRLCSARHRYTCGLTSSLLQLRACETYIGAYATNAFVEWSSRDSRPGYRSVSQLNFACNGA
jgi:hypothetical protein